MPDVLKERKMLYELKAYPILVNFSQVQTLLIKLALFPLHSQIHDVIVISLLADRSSC